MSLDYVKEACLQARRAKEAKVTYATTRTRQFHITLTGVNVTKEGPGRSTQHLHPLRNTRQTWQSETFHSNNTAVTYFDLM